MQPSPLQPITIETKALTKHHLFNKLVINSYLLKYSKSKKEVNYNH